jgi:hypothetical protein
MIFLNMEKALKFKSATTKAKTISEVCGQDEKAFERFMRYKEATLAKMEHEVDQRIRKHLAEKMALAA